MAQPTVVLIMRARKVETAVFISGSLVATIELMAQTRITLGEFVHHNSEHCGCDKNAHGIVDSMHVAFDEPLYSFHIRLRLSFAARAWLSAGR